MSKSADSRAKNILVAFGGPSPEHEVSVLTAMQAISALSGPSTRCIPLYIAKNGQWFTGSEFTELESYKDLGKLVARGRRCAFETNESGHTVLAETTDPLFGKRKKQRIDVVLCAFHGSDGENGSFQGVCEVFNLPYTGSGVAGSAVGMDKFIAKSLCRAFGFPVVPDVAFYESEWVEGQDGILQKCESIGFPLFVKPVSLGSSIGVARADDRKALIRKIEEAFRYDAHLIVEKGVHPLMELNCSVIGTPESAEASVLEHPVAASEVLTFEDKYQRGGSGKGMASAERVIPAPVDEQLTEKVRDMATGIFRRLNCSGLARLDFLYNPETKDLFFNEINTIPGSFSFYLWDHSGVGFPELLQRLIRIAEERHRTKNGRVRSYDTNLLSEKASRGLKGLKGIKGSRAGTDQR